MPESFSAFWRIVSSTAADTSRMFDVSVACVKCGNTLSFARLACIKRQRMYLAALLMSGPAVYSGKYFSRGTCRVRQERQGLE